MMRHMDNQTTATCMSELTPDQLAQALALITDE
jgi:hypothetical protein